MKSKCTRCLDGKLHGKEVYILCVHITSRAEGLLLGFLETFQKLKLTNIMEVQISLALGLKPGGLVDN